MKLGFDTKEIQKEHVSSLVLCVRIAQLYLFPGLAWDIGRTGERPVDVSPTYSFQWQ